MTGKRFLITKEVITEAVKQSKSGLSNTEIARLLGCSRVTVSRIIRGERDGSPKDKAEKKPGIRRGGVEYRRCPTCSRLVLLPCLACSLRDMDKQPSCDSVPDSPDDLRLELRGEEAERKRNLDLSLFRGRQRPTTHEGTEPYNRPIPAEKRQARNTMTMEEFNRRYGASR